ncbi:hypothetical protein Tco_1056820 [Tanacetum coccineum]|uniref:Uncharacterized protein n=1 Tax=Tanacetum coccineum TaxID=301880 RepID=A0ABQ5H5T9_9ASTR
MPPKRTSTSETPAITLAAIRQLNNDGISSALKAQAASMENTENINKNTGTSRTPVARKRVKTPNCKLLADIVSTLAVPRLEAVSSINRTMPIREACQVDVQRIQPGKQRPRKHAQARQHAKGQGPTPVSYASELSNQGPRFDMDMSDFMDVVGAACGVLDQMASACCEANKLLAMVFQFPMSENRSLYGKMIKSTASDISSQSYSNCNGNNIDELEEYEIELLHAEASLDYLCNLTPHNLKLSDTQSGEAFLTKYDHHNDPVTLKKLMQCFNYWFFELMVCYNSSPSVMIMELRFFNEAELLDGVRHCFLFLWLVEKV